MNRIGEDDEYPYHVYLTQMMSWVRQWVPDPAMRLATLEKMTEIAEEALIHHPMSRQIENVAGVVRRDYLELATVTLG